MTQRAAIYAWWRGKLERDGAEDLDVQERRCRTYAEGLGYAVVGAYRESTAGAGDERPELRRLRGAIWARRVDVVIATAPDRIFQEIERVARLANEAGQLGVRLEFLEAPLLLWEE